MRISAKVDYAARAMCELAAHDETTPLTAESIAESQTISQSFLENIMVDLKRASLVRASRGRVGGYRLTRPASSITIADIIRAVEGPLADVRGIRPEALSFDGPAEALRDVWLANRVSVRRVLEHVTIADVVSGTLPPELRGLLEDDDALVSH